MKLQELAAISPTKQAAKVFESYFGRKVAIDSISRPQAQNLLSRVRNLISEHRRNPSFHRSEQNPEYLKLIMMEQVLSARVKEDAMGGATVGMAQPSGGTAAKTDPAGVQAMQTVKIQQSRKQKQDQLNALQKQQADLQRQIAQVQKEISNPTMAESRRLREASELQQAQVVLASQDMVDQVQKMIEQVTSMQYKDLPALVDQIKNEIGVEQSTQFNADATAALAGLVQNLQGSKQQLETALGVVTGQAPVVPGEDMGAGTDMGLAGEPPAEELPAELPPAEELPEPGEEAPKSSLGRGRR